VYPLPTPGGWRLIGRTPLAMFRPDRASRLAIGDPRSICSDIRRTVLPRWRKSRRRLSAIEVLTPGLLTTVQDLGREGFGPMGVSASGAADAIALRLGNRLVWNPERALGWR